MYVVHGWFSCRYIVLDNDLILFLRAPPDALSLLGIVSLSALRRLVLGFFMQSIRLEFDQGTVLHFLTRDKDKTFHMVQTFTSRKQELLLPLVQNLPQAQMVALLQENSLEVNNEDLMVMESIATVLGSQNVRFYLLCYSAVGDVSAAPALAPVASTTVATAGTKGVATAPPPNSAEQPRWVPRSVILSEERIYLCREDYQIDYLFPPMPMGMYSSARPSKFNPAAMGLSPVNKTVLLQAWQASVADVAGQPDMVTCFLTDVIVSIGFILVFILDICYYIYIFCNIIISRWAFRRLLLVAPSKTLPICASCPRRAPSRSR